MGREGVVQLDIMHYLLRQGYLTLKEYLQYIKNKQVIPDHPGIFGRVNTGGVPAMGKVNGRWQPSGQFRSNPYNFIGTPDILGFTKFCKTRLLIQPVQFAIECKAPDGVLKPQQQIYKAWFEQSGGLYILGKTEEDVKAVL